MAQQRLSSWRRQTIHLHPELNEVDFIDSKPNVFFITNTSPHYLYVGMIKIPSEKSFEKDVKPNCSETFGRPLPLTKLYIYNPSVDTIEVELFSDNQDFDMAMLKSFNVNFEQKALDYIKFDGIVKGWDTLSKVHILSGESNSITSIIDTRSLQALVNAIKEKKVISSDATNQITAILGGESFQTLLDTLASTKIEGAIDIKSTADNVITANLSEDSLTKIVDAFRVSTSNLVAVFDTILLSSQPETTINFDSPITEIQMLSNDTEIDLVIEFHSDDSMQEFIISPGEVLSEIKHVNFNKLVIKATDTTIIPTGQVRYIFSKEVV